MLWKTYCILIYFFIVCYCISGSEILYISESDNHFRFSHFLYMYENKNNTSSLDRRDSHWFILLFLLYYCELFFVTLKKKTVYILDPLSLYTHKNKKKTSCRKRCAVYWFILSFYCISVSEIDALRKKKTTAYIWDPLNFIHARIKYIMPRERCCILLFSFIIFIIVILHRVRVSDVSYFKKKKPLSNFIHLFSLCI